MNDRQQTLHGVFIEVFGKGVLLSGESGIGKSELALGLIDRGHCLIADDSVLFAMKKEKVIGYCPPVLQDFLEVRGLGVLNIRALFGDTSIKKHQALHLIVRLLTIKQWQTQSTDRLHGLYREQHVLQSAIPEVTVPVAPGRNLAIMIEAAVRNHVLRANGYRASDEFLARRAQYTKVAPQESET